MADRSAWRKWYAMAAWRKLRAAHLAAHPLCVMCQEQGYTRAADTVDHSIAHRGDERLFFDARNLSSLCKPHHDSTAQARDRTGFVRGCDINGFPLDPNHPWRVERRKRAIDTPSIATRLYGLPCGTGGPSEGISARFTSRRCARAPT